MCKNVPISLVSVIIPTYNGLPELDTQLAALAAQDYEGQFEVIVSDNGSTDGLRAHLQERESCLDSRWVDSSGIRGPSHARNIGIDAARGTFLAFTDSDDAVHPHWLTALVAAAEHYDAVGGAVEVHSLNTPKTASWRVMPAPEQPFSTVYLPFAQGTNFGMWRRVVERVGYFDEQLVGGGEDVDYSWRIQQSGMTLGHVPDAVVAYRVRTSVRASFRQGIGYGRAAWPVLLKHRPQGCPCQPAPIAIAANFVTILYLATVRNPYLPMAYRPPARGRWAHLIGAQYGALRMRLQLSVGSFRRRPFEGRRAHSIRPEVP